MALKSAAQRKEWNAADFDEHGFRIPATDGTMLVFHKDNTTWNVIFDDRWGCQRLADSLAIQAGKIHEKLCAR